MSDTNTINPALVTVSHPANPAVYPGRGDNEGGLSTRAAEVSIPVLNGAVNIKATVYASVGKGSADVAFAVSLPAQKSGVTFSKAIRAAITDLVNDRVASWPEWHHACDTVVARFENELTGAEKAKAEKAKPAKALSGLKLAVLKAADGSVISTAPVEPTEPAGDTTPEPAPLTGKGTVPTAKAKGNA